MPGENLLISVADRSTRCVTFASPQFILHASFNSTRDGGDRTGPCDPGESPPSAEVNHSGRGRTSPDQMHALVRRPAQVFGEDPSSIPEEGGIPALEPSRPCVTVGKCFGNEPAMVTNQPKIMKTSTTGATISPPRSALALRAELG